MAQRAIALAKSGRILDRLKDELTAQPNRMFQRLSVAEQGRNRRG